MTDPTLRIRKREDLEALARQFVATPSAIPAVLLRPVSTFTALGVLTAAALSIVLLWPSADEAPRPSMEARAAMREAEHLQRRVAERRERVKASDSMRLSEASLNRMAAADRAVLREMRAKRLAGAAQQAQFASAESAKPAPAVAPATADACAIRVSELSDSGKLTYADVAQMKGARVDAATGHAFTPPVALSGLTVVFDVAPDGCVHIVRN